MRIAVIGTGTLAEALGSTWAFAGHEIGITGRSAEKAGALAQRIGAPATSISYEQIGSYDAVLLAVLWSGVEDALRLVAAHEGALEGIALIDPVNAVEHAVGIVLPEHPGSAAQTVAALAPGSHVVKAFHLYPAQQWTATGIQHGDRAVVPICGDDDQALAKVSELVLDAGGQPVVLGPLARARQLEEVAGFVIGLAFSGVDPRAAIPHLPDN